MLVSFPHSQNITYHSHTPYIDQVKVEYAFETARIRLYLPLKGETWFFVDNNVTLKGFQDQCKTEDSYLTDVKFYDANGTEYTNED